MNALLNMLLHYAPYDYFDALRRFRRNRRRDRSSKTLIDDYLNSAPSPKLHVGCGYNVLDGWLNTELELVSANSAYLDASKPFPFPDASFDFVYSEHMFEHLDFRASCNYLSESYRVLKPGGVLRTALPHIDFLCELYQHPETDPHRQYIQYSMEKQLQDLAAFFPEEEYSAVYVISNFFRDWGHQIMHSYDSLTALMSKFGYGNFIRREVGESDHPALQNIERHGQVIAKAANLLETMIVEAEKPPGGS